MYKSILGFSRKFFPNEVRVIGPDGEQMGIIPTYEAIKRAEEAGLDLVGVQPNAQPPVCKIMDYGKHKFDKQKAEKEAKKKQHKVVLKEVKVSPKIGKHDLEVKIGKIKKFLDDNNKVKISIQFRGRENIHKDLGVKLLKSLVAEMADFGSVEGNLESEGRMMHITLTP